MNPLLEQKPESKIYHEIISIAIAVVVIAIAAGGYFIFGYSSKSVKVVNEKPAERQQPAAKTQTGEQNGEKTIEEGVLIEEFVVQETPLIEKITVTSSAETQTLPPSKFQTFAYDKDLGKVISISGGCGDKYYAVLVFEAGIDYQRNPNSAKINRASECPPDKKFNIKFDLKDYNLPTGRYYFFVADQGETGTWYNPR